MTAKNAADSTIVGSVYEDYSATDMIIKFRYRISCNNPNKCQVGGLDQSFLDEPAPETLVTSGCVSSNFPIKCAERPRRRGSAEVAVVVAGSILVHLACHSHRTTPPRPQDRY